MNVADSYGIPSIDPVTDWNNRNVGVTPDSEGRWQYDIGLPSWTDVNALVLAVMAWFTAHARAVDQGGTPAAANQAGNEAFRDRYKVLHGCIDCERRPIDPQALHLDHRDDDEKAAQARNESDRSRAANIRWPAWRYVLEVAKCDVVCGHHHDVRTEARAQGITREEAAARIKAARRVTVLGALRAEGLVVETHAV
jgi:hypothetical protein